MKKYESGVIGDVVLIKNLIFLNSDTHKKQLDHAWLNGRPCLIIYSDDEYDYFLSLKSSVNFKYEYEHFELSEEDTLFMSDMVFKTKNKNRGCINGFVNLQTIYKIPISGHIQLGKLKFTAYKNIMNKLKDYKQNQSLEEIVKNAEVPRRIRR